MRLTRLQNNSLKKIASISSVSLASILCCAKAAAFFYTDSLAILSSLVDSLSDIFASLITFFAIKISVKPASTSFRYGYGKIESLSALFQAGFVAASGLFILYDTILRLKNPVPITQTTFGLIVMLISLVSTIALVSFQRFVAKRTKSQAIMADSLHYYVDILTNSSIIISLITTSFLGVNWIDSFVAGAIALYLLYNAYDLGKDAVNILMDKELSDEIRQSVYAAVSKHPISPKIHDLRTRDLGCGYIFEFHIEFDGKLSLSTTHRYTEEVENLIRQKYPSAQIIIHQDPIGIKENRLDRQLSG